MHKNWIASSRSLQTFVLTISLPVSITLTQSAATCSSWFLNRGFPPEDGGDMFSETSLHTRSTRRHIAEDGIIQVPCRLWNPKTHYYVQKSPTVIPILSQMNSVRVLKPSLFKIRCIILHPTSLAVTGDLPFRLVTKIIYPSISRAVNIPSSHPP
jgi:hypothetical protein